MKRKIIRIEPMDIFVTIGDSHSAVTIGALKVFYQGGDFSYEITKSKYQKQGCHKDKTFFKAQQGQPPQTH